MMRTKCCLIACASLCAACGVPDSATPATGETPTRPAAFLWKRYDGDGVDGYATEADLEDAWSYFSLSSADLSGVPGGAGDGVVPESLDAFKTQFNIPLIEPGEALADYRERIGAAVYFNANELGLGRELACSAAYDGASGRRGFLDSDGSSIGIGCFVTNYGGLDGFYDEGGAMDNVLSEAPSPKNTVALTWRPTREVGEQVQFWVYGDTGLLQPWAALDHQEGMPEAEEWRPVPSVCTECHGGI